MPTIQPTLNPEQLNAYFALMEVASLLRHAIEKQLLEDGKLSYIQFQLLARLGINSTTGSERMTDLADGVVCSRSGLTYQAQILEKEGLVTRTPTPNDDRGTTITITHKGRVLLEKVLPGHTAILNQQLFALLSNKDTNLLTKLLLPLRNHMRTAPPRSASPRSRKSDSTSV